MDAQQAQHRIKSMIDLIKKEAEEKAEMIKTNAEAQFNIEKNKILNQQKDKLVQQYRLKLEQYVVQKRIQRSTKINSARLEKMNARNVVSLKIRDETQQQLIELFNKDRNIYKDLVKKMICQGLIKLMEKEVQIRCRKEDVEYIEPILGEAGQMFKDIIKKETNVDFPINLVLDKNNYLENTTKIGGIILAAFRGKILCTNTIDNRLDLTFAESIPDLRRILFPDLTPKISEKKPEAERHKH